MDTKGLILLVEDDVKVMRINRRILESEGFAVLCAKSIAETREILKTHHPDVWVLDIILPDGSGLAFCKEVRGSTAAPVLFLTGLPEADNRMKGLLAGGNDYITKPYRLDEFVLRIRSLLELAQSNRRQGAAERNLVRGQLILDVVAQSAYLADVDLLLSPKEFSLLLFLIQRENKPQTAEQLYSAVWKQPMSGDANALKKALSRLRSKLEGSGFTISTRRGEGYRFEEG